MDAFLSALLSPFAEGPGCSAPAQQPPHSPDSRAASPGSPPGPDSVQFEHNYSLLRDGLWLQHAPAGPADGDVFIDLGAHGPAPRRAARGRRLRPGLPRAPGPRSWWGRLRLRGAGVV